MIDLHCHSTFSDGTFTPEKLLQHAKVTGVDVLALTDHDTVDGLDDFFAVDTDVERVAGTEISIDYGPGTFHLVGLFLDRKEPELNKQLDFLKDARRKRNAVILRQVSDFMGFEVKEKDIAANNEGELGRPHIAKYLIRQKKVGSMQEAFDKYLGKGKPLYAEKKRLGFDAALRMIHGAGGIAVLTHPVSLKLAEEDIFPFIKGLKEQGLDAMEVYCSEISLDQQPFYKDIADRLGLGVSGGSDFHGDNKLKISMGTGPGHLNNPRSIYDDLKKLAHK